MNLAPTPLLTYRDLIADQPEALRQYDEAEAKERLRDEGIVTGPDRFGNWCVPTTHRKTDGWQPGDPIDIRVTVRNNGTIAGTPVEHAAPYKWGWLEGRWVDNPERLGDEGGPLPLIF